VTSENNRVFAEWRPRENPWLIAVAVMLATFVEVLDTSVANVALPHMAVTFPPAPMKPPGF